MLHNSRATGRRIANTLPVVSIQPPQALRTPPRTLDDSAPFNSYPSPNRLQNVVDLSTLSKLLFTDGYQILS